MSTTETGRAATVNILQPLVSPVWGPLDSLPGLKPSYKVKCLWNHYAILKDNIYLAVNKDASWDVSNTLLVLPLDFSRSRKMSPPSWNFGLTVFQSRLTMVGGVEPETQVATNTLWTSGDGTGWEETLPPMTVKRESPSVITVGDPESLVVAGGIARAGGYVQTKGVSDAVEVLIKGKQWCVVQPLPTILDTIFTKPMVVHNGNLIIPNRAYYCCRVDKLLESCESESSAPSGGLWRELKRVTHGFDYNLHSFGQQLIATLDGLFVLSPDTRVWMHLEECPGRARMIHSMVFPSGELVCIFLDHFNEYRLRRITLKLPPHYIDVQFSPATAVKMEWEGYEILKSLTGLVDKFKKMTCDCRIPMDYPNTLQPRAVLSHWMACRSKTLRRPPTWRSLLEVMQELGLKELSQQVGSLLAGVLTLKETCMNVIMSNLLQQLNLNADQLQDRLPDYVPTTLRKAIVHNYKLPGPDTSQLPTHS